jgi:hypothetical protein
MARSIFVSAMENDTGRGLLSEVLCIPMLIRSESSTRLLNKSDMSKSFGFSNLWRSRPFSGLINSSGILGFLPQLTRGGTMFGSFLPEIWRK